MLPHGFESVADDFLHAISDSIKTADCSIAGVPGTVTALWWENRGGKAQMYFWELVVLLLASAACIIGRAGIAVAKY